MVRAPCCEKMGLKKGPWTPDEDQRLIAHIQKHGHGNWRALPKQAGLLRCGKSCRLRWTNYLRPDIKRGNFSREEEEAIINLHELLGNRWSAIAAKLPGRTDNEIKNVWHTHLKKRLKQHDDQTKKSSCAESHVMGRDQSESEEITSSSVTTHRFEHPILDSPIRCSSSSEYFSGAESPLNVISHEKYDDEMGIKDHDCIVSLENLPQIDDSLMWLQAMPLMDNGLIGVSDEKFTSGSTMVIEQEQKIYDAYFPLAPVSNTSTTCGSNMKEDNDFWRDLFREVGELTELPGF